VRSPLAETLRHPTPYLLSQKLGQEALGIQPAEHMNIHAPPLPPALTAPPILSERGLRPVGKTTLRAHDIDVARSMGGYGLWIPLASQIETTGRATMDADNSHKTAVAPGA
jgi:hypothetical protein